MLEGLYLLVVYPIYTFWFANHASIFDENLSYVGNLDHLHWAFILWGLLTVLALALGLRTCIDHSLFKKRNRMLVMLAACLLMLAVTLPYRPLDLPLLSLIHILLSFAAPLSLLAAVFMIFMDLRMLYPSLMVPYLSVFLLICVIALGIYFKYASVNTLVEIFLSITVSNLLKCTARNLTKVSGKIDEYQL